MENICKQKTCDLDFQCKDPIAPGGQCCQTCGAVLRVYFDPSLNFDSLAQFVETEIRNDYDSTVISFSLSKQYENVAQRDTANVFIQILLGTIFIRFELIFCNAGYLLGTT